MTTSTSLFNGKAAASGDGTRIYAGGNGLSPPDDVVIYNPQSNTFSGTSVSVNLFAISVSGDASRVILQSTSVYSRSLTLLGNLAPNDVALASRDSSRAYVYRDEAPGPRHRRRLAASARAAVRSIIMNGGRTLRFTAARKRSSSRRRRSTSRTTGRSSRIAPA